MLMMVIKNITLAGAWCRLKIFLRDPPLMHRILMKLWCSLSNINFNQKKNTFFHLGPQILFAYSVHSKCL